MTVTEVETWFDSLAADQQQQWLAAKPQAYSVSKALAGTVPSSHDEKSARPWVIVVFAGFVGAEVVNETWYAFGALARLIADRRGD